MHVFIPTQALEFVKENDNHSQNRLGQSGVPLTALQKIRDSILMKNLIAALLFCISSAHAAPLPPDPCAGLDCSDPMKAIAANFKAGTGFREGELPYLASGACYHSAYYYNPNIMHFGVAFMDLHEGDVYMGGSFGFFYKENPYKSMTIEEARQIPRLYDPNHKMSFGFDYAFADMNPGGEEPWLYWVKQDNGRLYLIGQWGFSHRVFCEMVRHE